MKFTKVHGLGNDFILVDATKEKLPQNLSALAEKLCNRHFGIGADGLVIIRPSKEADIGMHIINSDGSEAEMCGNAIRCVAKYVYEKGIIEKKEIQIETKAGIIVPEVKVDRKGTVDAVRVNMGAPRLERKDIPMEGPAGKVVEESLKVGEHTFKITALSMGNPHCIIFVSDVETVPVSHWGPRIETHSAFPRKTNVEFVQVINRSELKMRVWERGAGQTLACGTGACASAVAACLRGFADRNVTVHLLGGSLHIEWLEQNNNVYMTGPAEEIFTGEYFLREEL